MKSNNFTLLFNKIKRQSKLIFNWNKILLPVFISGLLVYSCATPVAPTGGPKDETPPVVVESEPENYTTHFKGKEITITFNEFVQLKEITGKLMVSPPMETAPEIKTKGKSVVIEILDTLAKNTTYSFFFGDAIVDLHENNPIDNFRYVFSTGPDLDSMQISGRLADAFTLKPVENVLVMLYKKHYDSVPLKKIPFYISKTDEKGHFRLSNLGMTKYKLFALKDANSNYLFDLPNEKIAFSDSLITPTEITERKTFSTPDTAVTPEADTLAADTPDVAPDTVVQHAHDHAGDSIILRFFKERDTLLRLTTSKLHQNRYITLGFNKRVDSLTIIPLKPDLPKDWHIKEWFAGDDSLRIWLKDFDNDTLMIDLEADNRFQDTITYTYFPSEQEKPKEQEALTLKAELDGSTQLLRHPLTVTFNAPTLITAQADSLALFSSADTTNVAFRKEGLRKIRIDHRWQESESYRLYIPDSAFTSIYGNSNDSTMINFRTKAIKDYGTLIVSIKGDSLHGEAHYLLQLLTKDEKEQLKSFSLQNDTTLKIELLNPGQYKLKGIVDKNNNKRWDSGIYLRKEQPEKVFYYPGAIEVIGNWDVELDWKIEP
jgi:hypothetical protein